MSLGDWLGMVSLLLAVPVGITANMLTPRLVAYLEHRKLVQFNRSKDQDVAAYRGVEAFKNGTRDKYASYLGLSVMSINCGTAGCVTLCLALLKYADQAPSPMYPSPFVFLCGFAAVLFMFSVAFLALIAITESRLRNFDEYTKEVREKWGPDAV